MTIHKRDFAVPPFEIIHARSKDEIQQCFNIVSSPHSHWNDSISLSLSLENWCFSSWTTVSFGDRIWRVCNRKMEKRIHSDFLSSKEEHATHLLLRLTPSLLPIGTIRGYLIPNTTDTYQLTRLALLKDYREYGFGRHLVEAFHDWVKSDASSTTGSVIIHPPQPRQIKINCHSQIYAKGFYSKCCCLPCSLSKSFLLRGQLTNYNPGSVTYQRYGSFFYCRGLIHVTKSNSRAKNSSKTGTRIRTWFSTSQPRSFCWAFETRCS